MLRKIKVYGKLRKFLGWDNGTYWADVNSATEVGRFLVANWPGVKKHMIDQFYKVTIGNFDIGDDEVNNPIGQETQITIVPIAIGAKGFFKSGIGKVVAGVALVGLTVATGGFGGAMIGTFGIGAGSIGVGTIVAGIGVSMALGGVSQMLSPVPEYPTSPETSADTQDPQSNHSFSGIQNVSRSGTPIPLVYGHEIYIGSILVNNGIDTVQVEGTA